MGKDRYRCEYLAHQKKFFDGNIKGTFGVSFCEMMVRRCPPVFAGWMPWLCVQTRAWSSIPCTFTTPKTGIATTGHLTRGVTLFISPSSIPKSAKLKSADVFDKLGVLTNTVHFHDSVNELKKNSAKDTRGNETWQNDVLVNSIIHAKTVLCKLMVCNSIHQKSLVGRFDAGIYVFVMVNWNQ